MNNKFLRFWMLIVIMSVLPISASRAVNFAVLYSSDDSTVMAFMSLLKPEVTSLLKGEFSAQFPKEKMLKCNSDSSIATNQFSQLMHDQSVSMILVIGEKAVQIAAQQKSLNKPVIAPLVMDARLQSLPKATNGGSGRDNFLYTAAYPNFSSSMNAYKSIFPFDTLALLVASEGVVSDSVKVLDSVPIKVFSLKESPQATVTSLPVGCKAVLTFGMPSYGQENQKQLFALFAESGVAVFSYAGVRDVQLGALASNTGEGNFVRLSRTTALNIQRILLGKNPSSISSNFRIEEQLSVNSATLEKLNKELPWAVQKGAQLIAVSSDSASVLKMNEAIAIAIDSNVTYLAKQMETEAGSRDLKRSRSTYVPSVIITGAGTFRDVDLVNTGGAVAQNSLVGDIKIRQQIFSDKSNTSIAIQKRYQTSREAELSLTKKEISLAAASAYLRVLQAESNLKITKEDYALTKSNLEIAKKREASGSSSLADVYRLESELAYREQDMVSVQRLVNQTRYDLNALLRRELETSFTVYDTIRTMDAEQLLTAWTNAIASEQALKRFRDYTAKLAIDSAPEILQISALIEAKEKEKKEQFREFLVPAISAEGDLTDMFVTGGATNPGAPTTPFNTWMVGLYATWDLFDGGRQIIDRKQANYEMQQLEFSKIEIEQQLTMSARTALLDLREAIAGIVNADVAAKAAEKNFDLVSQNYAQGAADIEALLGAQTSYFTAQQRSYNSRYQYRLNELQVESAINRIDYYQEHDFVTILEDFKKWESEQSLKSNEFTK